MTRITTVSPDMEALLGYPAERWQEDPGFWARVTASEDRERVRTERARELRAGRRFVAEYRMLTRDERIIWVRDVATVVSDGPDDRPRQCGVLVDVSERKEAEEALRHQALHDALTDLPNRSLFIDRAEQAIRASRRTGDPVTLLLLDLDRFGEVNVTFGHQYGDLLLRRAVVQLRGALREEDTIARLGGDEFAILLPGLDTTETKVLVARLLQTLRQSFEAEGQSLHVGGSIGIALYPEHGRDASALLQRADIAMCRAKRSHSGFAFYDPESDPHSPARLALVGDLRRAIYTGGLVLHYQPKASLRTGAAQHFEALVRWQHPTRGLLGPDSFISLAEHAGLIKSLSVWVLETALEQCSAWRRRGLDISVAVNVSPRMLHDADLVPTVALLLERWQVEPGRLEVEITETALMEDPASALQTLTALHDMGVCISIDDFGTGYSSLSYLTRVPADQIKIDKSFVLDMTTNADSAFIVRSVVDLGHNLGLQVVAEGVETQRAWDLLAGMGCDIAQGFHLSPPLTPADVAEWLGDPAARAGAGDQ